MLKKHSPPYAKETAMPDVATLSADTVESYRGLTTAIMSCDLPGAVASRHRLLPLAAKT